MEKNLTLQPHICIVGPLENPEKCYVIVDSVKYEVFTVFEAVRLTFKLFWALNVSYSKLSEKIWYFFELVGFEMKENNENKNLSTKAQTFICEFYKIQKEMLNK